MRPPSGHRDAVIFYTDGVTEAVTHGGEQWGEDGLRRLTGGLSNATAEEQARRIVEGLQQATRRRDRFDDDVTLIVVRNISAMRASSETFRAAPAEALT